MEGEKEKTEDFNYIIISTYNGEYKSYKGDTDELMQKYELFCPLSDNALCLGVLENSYYDNLKQNKFCSWWYGGEMRGDCLLLWEGEATHETVKIELETLINCWKAEDKKKAEAVRDDLKGFREEADKREAERMQQLKEREKREKKEIKEKKKAEQQTAEDGSTSLIAMTNLNIWREGGGETQDEFFNRIITEKEKEEGRTPLTPNRCTEQEKEEKENKEKQEKENKFFMQLDQEAEQMRQLKRIENNERTERDKKGLIEILELCEIIKGKFKSEGKKAEFKTFMNDLLKSMNP
jgi:hypothetical protein